MMLANSFGEVYAIMEYLRRQNNTLPNIDKYVHNFLKSNSKINIEEYTIVSSRSDSPNNLIHSGGFSLELRSKNNEGLALISWNQELFCGERKCIPVVVQIQSVPTWRGRTEEIDRLLKPLKWERMLVKVLEDLALNCNFDSIGILPAERNKWYKERYCEGTGFYVDGLEEHQTRMRMRYNITAKRMGYQYDLSLGLFIKKLNKEFPPQQAGGIL